MPLMYLDLLGVICYFILAIILEIIFYFFTDGTKSYKKLHFGLLIIVGIAFFIYKF